MSKVNVYMTKEGLLTSLSQNEHKEEKENEGCVLMGDVWIYIGEFSKEAILRLARTM